MITSPSNPKLKHVKRLLTDRRYRRKTGEFVIEGNRWLQELIAADREPLLLLVTESWLARPDQAALLVESGWTYQLLDEKLLKPLAATQSPSGVLATVKQPRSAWPEDPDLVLVLDGVQDPGNLGTLIRSATAVGLSALVLAPGCVDPFNPKVVRSSMGGLLHLPILAAEWSEIEARLAGLTLYVAEGGAPQAYDQVDWRRPSALIIGSEAHGPSPDALQLQPLPLPLAIPIAPGVESLNAAVAGSVILFEAARQRRLAAS